MTTETPTEASFRKALDRHGYGFQYSLLRRIQELRSEGASWYPLVPEFGVEAKGRDTRIDFVLESRATQVLLVCECKRANPALANWCFARLEWPQKDYYTGVTSAPTIHRTSEGDVLLARHEFLHTDNAYQLALEVRTGEHGDQSGAARGEIEETATQVCRGFNGLLNFLRGREDLLPRGVAKTLVPVLFTTASLWVSTIDIGQADINTGQLSAGTASLERRDWVWLDYPQSPGVMHSLGQTTARRHLTEAFYAESLRRIAVVSPNGVAPFLRSQTWLY